MSYRPPGTLRVLRLLAWTSVLRLLRAMRIARSKRLQKPGARTATQRKRGSGLTLLMLAMLPLFAFQSLLITSQAVQQLAEAVQRNNDDPDVLVVDSFVLAMLQRTSPQASDRELVEQLTAMHSEDLGNPPAEMIVEHFRRRGVAGFERAPPASGRGHLLVEPVTWTSDAAAATFVNAGTLLLVTMLALLLTIGFGGANTSLAGGEWTFSWLLTFPVTTRSLVLAKACEYSLVQFFPWLMLFPLLLQLLLALDQPGALWIALAGTVATTFLTGSLRLWAETRLRLFFSLRGLRSIQGACSLLALLLMALLFRIGMAQQVPAWFVDLARAAPAWLRSLPTAWPMALVRDGLALALPGALLTLAAFAFACFATTRLLAHGSMRSGGVDPGTRGKKGRWASSTRRLGVVGKDLAMLLRDRNFLVQTLVVPVFVIGLQLIVNPGLGRAQGRGVAALAYGIGIYSLIGGCFQVLSAEGRALWMLYTLPIGIAEVLRRKTRIWASTATAFALTALVTFTLREGGAPHPQQLLLDALFVAAGVWCAAHIAAGVSILGTDPAADHVPRQAKARHVYLYFFFAGTYFMALQSPELTGRCAGLLVFATLAYAVWQRATDRVPWLLDPVDEQRGSIGVYDGAAAMVVFFVLQGVVLLITMRRGPDTLSAQALFLAFSIAGAITVFLFLMMVSLRGVDLVDGLGLRARSLPSAAGRLLLGVLAGAATGAIGLSYLHLVRTTGWIDLPPPPPDVDRTALLLLAVIAAPLCEEIIFRGLLFQGLRRSVKLPLAVLWSAALFAAVHPAHSWLPVFVMGATAALVFHRTRLLPAAMAVHAVYNLIVVGFA